MVAGRQGMKLEAFKFGIYIGIPVLAAGFFNEPETVRWFVDYFQYVKYPAPASADPELRKQLKEQAEKRKLIQQQRNEYKKQLNQLDQLVTRSNDNELQNNVQSKSNQQPWWKLQWLIGSNKTNQ